jgi:hypothetical protein
MKVTYILAAVLAFAGSTLTVALGGGGGNFDHLSDADRKIFQERFVKEIWPLFERGGKYSCVGCHSGKADKIVSSLKMSGNAEKDFRMLLKEGFFIPDDPGSMHSRIIARNKKLMMPPPGKADPWTKADADLLRKFVDDVEAKQQPKKK